ncbi:SSU ribosomal protein S6p [hydrothermal vent metagenome]|uniref:SSU ribosomal protein S6p n=1 Tax=hydrothermal vent metagenome TaxID=652676 RepID=A0A3B0V683_9ZZZZ
MVNQYETVFILTPVLSEDQVKETVKTYEKLITDNGGELVNRENWGMRKLAYPIQKKSTGFYNLFEYRVDGSYIEKLEVLLKRDERVMRFLTVKLDKHAIAYSGKRRKKFADSKKAETAEKKA